MIRNYIKIAWRNIVKQGFYSLLNIAGLAFGIAFALLIGAFVWAQRQVNSDLKDLPQQYILQSNWKEPNMGFNGSTLGALPPALKAAYPNLVANYFRWDGLTATVTHGDRAFRESVQISDTSLFSMYGLKVSYGNVNTALKDPYAVVITEAMAKKYFGRTDALGQSLSIENFSGVKHDFIVSAILKPSADNSILNMNGDEPNPFILPMTAATFFNRDIDNWYNQYVYGALELKPGVGVKAMEQAIHQLMHTQAPPTLAANVTPYLEPLADLHLSAHDGLVRKMCYALSIIAGFILFMAVINFVNMSVSSASSRMKEIGIRKVLGGLKRQLVIQFLTESVILVAAATILAIALYFPARPLFSHMLNSDIPGITDFPLYFIALPFVLILVTGLGAGLYPAFVLSSVKAIDNLKGTMTQVKDKVLFRKLLVGFQFVIAAVTLMGAVMITRQVDLFFSKDLGYNKDFLVTAQVPRDWSLQGVNKMEGIRQQFASMPEVSNATLSFEIPNGNNSGNLFVYKEGADSATAKGSIALNTDEYYAAAYGIGLSSGVFFNEPGNFTDADKVVINQQLATALGFKDASSVVGQHVRIHDDATVYTVAGVTKDFHFGSMQQAIQPAFMLHIKHSTIYRFLTFRIKPGAVQGSLNALQKQWMRLMPGAPFEYKFMDDQLNNLYQSEMQLRQAAYTGTGLSLIIVLLGIIGLVSLNLKKRAREIGIRKVLGSSVQGIVVLFVKDFLPVVILAGVVACPIAWILLQQWLNGYVYRVDLTWSPFAGTVLLMGLICTVLIALQTMRTAMANPLGSLRSE